MGNGDFVAFGDDLMRSFFPIIIEHCAICFLRPFSSSLLRHCSLLLLLGKQVKSCRDRPHLSHISRGHTAAEEINPDFVNHLSNLQPSDNLVVAPSTLGLISLAPAFYIVTGTVFSDEIVDVIIIIHAHSRVSSLKFQFVFR